MSDNKKIKWVDVQKENDHFFIRAEVGYLNEVIKIRFGIDKKTADGIRSVLREKPFKEKYGNEYSYWHSGYMTDKPANNYGHYIEIRLGKMRHKTKIQCSRSFCENLKWLSEIKSVSDLNGLLVNE